MAPTLSNVLVIIGSVLVVIPTAFSVFAIMAHIQDFLEVNSPGAQTLKSQLVMYLCTAIVGVLIVITASLIYAFG
jgi:hypothetical protein